MFDNGIVVGVVVGLVFIVGLIAFIASRLVRVPPNEALIIVGRGGRGKRGPNGEESLEQEVIIGGRKFVMPILQEAFPVSLEQRNLSMEVEGVDKNYIATRVNATVLFKVRGDEDGVRRAAQRFLSQQGDLETPMRQALEGALRPIIGSMTIENLISDRESLQEQVVSSIKTDLAEQGFQVDLVNLSDISTPGSDYLRNLGRRQAAEAQKEAEVAEAQTRLQSENARIETEEKVAERTRDLALKKAGIKAQTDKADAEAIAAGQLARAEQDRLVATQQREALSEQARVTEEQLDIDIRKPAEARAYAQVQDANAKRDSDNAAAEADAFRREKIANANKTAAILDAEAVEATGKAEASAIQAKGLALAASTEAQAQALATQGQAVLAQQYIDKIPEIAQAIAGPLGSIEGLTIVSTDGAGAVTKSILDMVAQAGEVLPGLLPNGLSGLFNGAGNADATSTVVTKD